MRCCPHSPDDHMVGFGCLAADCLCGQTPEGAIYIAQLEEAEVEEAFADAHREFQREHFKDWGRHGYVDPDALADREYERERDAFMLRPDGEPHE